MRCLESNSICIFVHEEEYGTSALYIHSSRALKQVVDLNVLSQMDIQLQRAWTFQICPPYNADRLQEIVSFYCASQKGVNAGYINRTTNLLTIFEDKDATKSQSFNFEAFNVCLCFQKDVCPFGEMPLVDQDEVTVCIRGNCSGVAELESIKEALGLHHDPSIKAMWVSLNGLGLHVLPNSKEHLLQVRTFVLNVLGSMGLISTTKWNNVVLYEEERAIIPSVAEITIGQDCCQRKLSAMSGKQGGYDLIMRLFWELGLNGHLKRRPHLIAISLSGCKCLKCGQAIMKAVLRRTTPRVDLVSVHLNLGRNVLLVTAAEEHQLLCIAHIRTMLSELGIKSGMVFSDPLDLDGSESLRGQLECENYVRSLKPSNKAIAPSAGSTEILEVGLLPEAVRCQSCCDLLQSTLRIMVPGLRNLVVTAKAAELMVEYETDHVTETEIVASLRELGYQPEVISRGRHLQPKLYEDLLAPFEDLMPVKRSSLPDANLFGLPDGECIAKCPAKLIIRSQPGIVKDEILIVYSFAQDVVPLNTTFQRGASETMRMYVQDAVTSIILPIEDPSLADAELEFPFTIWYDRIVDRNKGEQTMTRLQTFTTLQQFWLLWSSIDLYKLQEQDVLMLFRDSIPPDLNHAVNRAGGRWYTRALPQETRRKLWVGVALAVIGQTLQDNTCNEVCGVVLSVKPGGDRVEVWVDGGYHHQLKYGHERAPLYRQLSSTMGDILGRVLKLAAGPQRLHYWTHEAYERHRRLHSGSARRDKRKQYAKQLTTNDTATGSSEGMWGGSFGD